MTSVADAFAKLGLTPDADALAVRQAYARQLKRIDQASEIAAFQALREAYDTALAATQRGSGETSPAAAPAPVMASHAEFDDLACRLADLAGPEEAVALLQQALQSVSGLEAGILLERRVAELLARGWQPGHEFLFDAASAVFNWTQDRRHLQALGDAGLLLQEALIQQQVFLDQPADVLDRQYALVRRLRDPSPPSPTLLRDEKPLLKVLARRFPHWLHVATSTARIEQWLGGRLALQTALAAPDAGRPIESSKRQLSDGQVIGFLIWLALMAWYHFG